MIAPSPARTSRRTRAIVGAAVALAFVIIAAFVPRGASTIVPDHIEKASVTKAIRIVAPTAASLGAAAGALTAPFAEARAKGGPIERRIARSASVGLIVAEGDTTIARIASLAHRSGGEIIALNDNAPSTPGERHTAELTLGVPDANFETVLGRFANLGTVSARTIATEDLGDKLVDAEARLRNLRREENDLRRIMDRSGKVGEILEVEGRLANVRESIETLDAQRAAMEHRVLEATIAISLSDIATTTTLAPTAAAQIADAWRAALANVQSFSIALAGRIFVAIAFAPYLLAIAVAALACRVFFTRTMRGTRGA